MTGKQKKPAEIGMQLVAQNRRARFDYSVEETLEAGLSLVGSEVKDLRLGYANLSEAYALPRDGEMFLLNAQIGQQRKVLTFAHAPTRNRKLLMHRHEIEKWTVKVNEKGYTIIPLRLYFKESRAKIELALCRGKTHEDRRSDIKERETKREIDRAMRRR